MNTLSSDYRFDLNYYRLHIAALPHQCILPFTQHAVIYQLKNCSNKLQKQTNQIRKLSNGKRWIAGKSE